MKITVLIENDSADTSSELTSEWGLSLYIAFGNQSILFDTGKSGAFADNAGRLNVDISSVQAAVLSHHHYDHGGGLRRFLGINSKAKVYLAEPSRSDLFSKKFNIFKRKIGIDQSVISEFPDRFSFVGEVTEMLPNVFIFSRILSSHPKPIGNRRLYSGRGGKLVHDDFSHEIVMAIREEDKLVIFTGCAHNGILNMVDTVSNKFEGIPIKAVIGGFHLVSSPPFNSIAGSRKEVEELGKAILNYPVGMTFTCHCTGKKAFNVLKSVMGKQLTDIKTGSCFEI